MAQKLTFNDANGAPLAGSKLDVYLASTTTRIDSYTSSDKLTKNTNPLILDSLGQCALFIDERTLFKLVLKSAAGVNVWTLDNLATGGVDDVATVDSGVTWTTGIDTTGGTGGAGTRGTTAGSGSGMGGKDGTSSDNATSEAPLAAPFTAAASPSSIGKVAALGATGRAPSSGTLPTTPAGAVVTTTPTLSGTGAGSVAGGDPAIPSPSSAAFFGERFCAALGGVAAGTGASPWRVSLTEPAQDHATAQLGWNGAGTYALVGSPAPWRDGSYALFYLDLYNAAGARLYHNQTNLTVNVKALG